MSRLGVKVISSSFAIALVVGALAGCGSVSDRPDLNTEVPEGAAPVLPIGHEGRFDRLGADGCYGCHGSNEEADPMLINATALPDDHYVNSDRTTREIDSSRTICTSCHVQGIAPSEG